MSGKTSKAFRAQLSGLSGDQTQKLDSWMRENCSLSAVFTSDRYNVIAVGVRDKARSSASFSRSLRTALNQLEMPMYTLHGRWLTLISDAEAIALCRPEVGQVTGEIKIGAFK